MYKKFIFGQQIQTIPKTIFNFAKLIFLNLNKVEMGIDESKNISITEPL